MQLTATHINYYIICPRKLWLFSNGINMESTSDIVYDGKLLHETSYPQRAEKYSEVELSATYKQIELSGKVDFYDAKEKVIHETKRGDKVEQAHEWQVKFYIWLFEQNGIDEVIGQIEYPKLRKITEVFLSDPDRSFLEEAIMAIKILVNSEACPPVINANLCRQCSYYQLCYIDEL
jgi:CRISPR-associated exonuclease Cas4